MIAEGKGVSGRSISQDKNELVIYSNALGRAIREVTEPYSLFSSGAGEDEFLRMNEKERTYTQLAM